MVVAFPRMRRQSGLTVVSVASTVLIYRSAAVILLAISVAVYVYVLIVTDSRNGGAAQSARRWRFRRSNGDEAPFRLHDDMEDETDDD